ncbi:cupin domain-containing protein [Palaeococcus ferrophilus]|uniref:cupin domain-containing protein n=1 Tax=Palaeococcus ferrophilus TaxID=83868 RepID=UPI00064E6B10|nr:cupin domain-containing protein [Palaeococcus ferrophilus]
MIVSNFETAERIDNPHGVDVRALLSRENVKVLVVTLKPGEVLERHTTPVDAFLYILKGKALVEVGKESAEARKDSLVFLPREVPHAVENAGSLPLRFLVVKLG